MPSAAWKHGMVMCKLYLAFTYVYMYVYKCTKASSLYEFTLSMYCIQNTDEAGSLRLNWPSPCSCRGEPVLSRRPRGAEWGAGSEQTLCRLPQVSATHAKLHHSWGIETNSGTIVSSSWLSVHSQSAHRCTLWSTSSQVVSKPVQLLGGFSGGQLSLQSNQLRVNNSSCIFRAWVTGTGEMLWTKISQFFRNQLGYQKFPKEKLYPRVGS